MEDNLPECGIVPLLLLHQQDTENSFTEDLIAQHRYLHSVVELELGIGLYNHALELYICSTRSERQ
jgi:hypothetical protein